MSGGRNFLIVTGVVLVVATVGGVALYPRLRDALSTCSEPTSRPSVPPRADWGRVSRGFHELTLGMTAEDVVAVLGEPDERWPLYTPQIMNGRRVGTTLFYFQFPELAFQGEGEYAWVYVDLHGRVMRVLANFGGNEYEKGVVPKE